MTASPRAPVRRPFFWLHAVWLLLWGGVLVLMLLPSSQAGHPPIMVFWFYPVGYGIFGHLILLGLGLVKRLSDKVVADSETQSRSWPLPIWIAIVAYTIVVVSGLATVALQHFIPGQAATPQRVFQVLAWQLPATILAAIAIFGIATRKRWARFYVPALVVLVWASWPGLLIYAAFLGNVSPMALVHFTWLSALLLGYAIWFFRSDKVKRFFGIELRRNGGSSHRRQ